MTTHYDGHDYPGARRRLLWSAVLAIALGVTSIVGIKLGGPSSLANVKGLLAVMSLWTSALVIYNLVLFPFDPAERRLRLSVILTPSLTICFGSISVMAGVAGQMELFVAAGLVAILTVPCGVAAMSVYLLRKAGRGMSR